MSDPGNKELSRPSRHIPKLGEIGLNNVTPYTLNRIAGIWDAGLAGELRTFDITPLKLWVLALLSVSSSLTVSELSSFAAIEQSTMSRTIDALREHGLIHRTTRPEDMRVREVSISDEGRATFEAAWPTVYTRMVRMFDDVNEEERLLFMSTLQKIMRNLQNY